jgi:hypothetical protein
LDFQPSPAAQQRALKLLELAKLNELTAEQESELDHFTELENILRIAKAPVNFATTAETSFITSSPPPPASPDTPPAPA